METGLTIKILQGDGTVAINFGFDSDRSWKEPRKWGPAIQWNAHPGYENDSVDRTTEVDIPRALLKALDDIMLMRLDASALAKPSYEDTEVPALRLDGEGLGAVIADLIISEAERLERILAQLQKLFPTVRKIRAERAKVFRELLKDDALMEGALVEKKAFWGHRVLLDTIHGDGIPLHHASEGVILALGLLTILNSKTAPRILLWDDMDKAFHPKAQQDLIKLIRGILEEIPDLQIIGTTHSPYLLDELSYDEVRVMATRDDGTPVCAPLVDHPEFKRWKDDVKPGELWMSYLENWVKQARGTEP